MRAIVLCTAVLVSTSIAEAQRGGAGRGGATRQTQADDYTRYELLAPGSGKFRILYEVTATTAGATQFFNAIRQGSVATDEAVYDRATGKPLAWDIVGADVARAGGVGGGGAAPDTLQKYIRVTLARAVPADGEGRVLIDKTYYDTTSYYVQGDVIVFTRPLGIKRNAVVLPLGYDLVSLNYPSQVLHESDGRVAVSFWNNTPGEAAVTLRARKAATNAAASPSANARIPADRVARTSERAHQNREIVYSLLDPATHSFDLYHDYTESRPGVATYINEVRAGSTVSNPRARNLDSGEDLKWEVLKGAAITAAQLNVQNVTPQSEIVVFRFTPVPQGGSTRIRMYETYTDTARYKVVNGELIWDRSFGRPANAVILPVGWALTNSSIPTVVSETADGRTRVDFINPRPDEINVLITARRRQ
ncbi:MAG TPA: hypothetical protein VJR92_03125 [Gemmatimonadaceae bacterium]|nr:hypothetical protein [Gemmatimonadaceae bacterium]